MIVHLVDGTYELFRHFYGIRRFKSTDPPLGAVAGVLGTVVQMIQEGATHIGVATDHVIESFRNDLWPDYKTGAGIERALWAQFGPLVVQVDRKSGQIRDDAGVRAKFGVAPAYIPDYLALVGDAADGYPGIPRLGPKTAARLIHRHGPIEQFPPEVLGDNRERALLFKKLATLRTDAPLFNNVDELRWNGATASFQSMAAKIEPRPAKRVGDLKSTPMTPCTSHSPRNWMRR